MHRSDAEAGARLFFKKKSLEMTKVNLSKQLM